MSRRRPAAGFTLLEIVVTMAILGIVMGIVYGVFAQTLSSKDRAERRGGEVADARSALLRIAADLGALRPGSPARAAARVPPTNPNPSATPTPSIGSGAPSVFLSRDRAEDGLPRDDLAFTALVRRPSAGMLSAVDLAVVQYFVGPVTGSKRPGLFRQTVYSLSGDAWDPDEPDPTATRLLLEGVVGIEIRFFDGRDWVQEWDSTDERNFAPAPLAVELVLHVADADGAVESYTTAVDLPFVRATARRTPQAGGVRGGPAGGEESPDA